MRVRPLSDSESKANYANVLTKEDERTCVMAGDAATATGVRDWEFDKIFWGNAEQVRQLFDYPENFIAVCCYFFSP